MYYRPAEWQKHKTIWLAWPADKALWENNLLPAQEEFLALVNALMHEHVVIIAPSAKDLDVVESKIELHANLSVRILPYGDIWLRDTFPIFVKDENGKPAAILPRFNGWGQKYAFDNDLDLNERVVKMLSMQALRSSVVFEGGAIESDGEGCILTTEQCLLNDNRNPEMSKRDIEKEFARCFGAKKVIWIKEGLKNDHTDGHIDTIARFIAPKTIAIMSPTSKSDPNYDVLVAIKNQLASERDANGNPFTLVEIPSPGEVKDQNGKIMPASYLNFIMGDETFVVPLYGVPQDEKAVAKFAQCVDLPVMGLSAKAILSGGGAFHCISQEFYR